MMTRKRSRLGWPGHWVRGVLGDLRLPGSGSSPHVTCRSLQCSALTRLNGEGRNVSGHAGSGPGRTARGKAPASRVSLTACRLSPPVVPAALTAGAPGYSGPGCFQPGGLCRYQPLVKPAASGRICAERYARRQLGGRAVPCLTWCGWYTQYRQRSQDHRASSGPAANRGTQTP
jgi:hypothetical protein